MSNVKTANDLEDALTGFLPALDQLDASDPEGCTAALNEQYPFDGETVGAIRAICDEGLKSGWLVPKEAGPSVRFGRLSKDFHGYAVDLVLMKEGSGRGHTHPQGEFNMCFPIEGAPMFDGNPPGWLVYGNGSHHVPTVTGGTMLFVYFTPGGDVIWDR